MCEANISILDVRSRGNCAGRMEVYGEDSLSKYWEWVLHSEEDRLHGAGYAILERPADSMRFPKELLNNPGFLRTTGGRRWICLWHPYTASSLFEQF